MPSNKSRKRSKKKGPLPSGSTPTLPKTKLPRYASFLNTKHPGVSTLCHKDDIDVTKPILPMRIDGGTLTTIFPDEPAHGADVVAVYEGRAKDLLKHCKVGAYKALSTSQRALLDKHGGVGLVEFKKMQAAPEQTTTLLQGVVFPGTLDMGEFLAMKTTLLEAAEKENMNLVIAIATTA